jgi:nicotinate-nucleotide adenylyltransferase
MDAGMERRLTQKERIGIFGGTFDPPHIGHQILAMEAYDELKLDKLFWVLAPQPPHKIGKKITPIDIRIKMVQAAIQHDEVFEMSTVDIDRPGPHYVLETVKIFRSLYPHGMLIFLIGGDSLHNLPDWHQPQEFLDACDKLGVMHRPGEKLDLEGLEKKMPGLSQKVEFIEAPLLEISSNLIRQLVAAGKPFRYYLPQEVYKIVQQKKLYRDEPCDFKSDE